MYELVCCASTQEVLSLPPHPHPPITPRLCVFSSSQILSCVGGKRIPSGLKDVPEGKDLRLLSMIMIRCAPPSPGCSRCVSSNMIGMIKVLPGEMTASSVIRNKTFVSLQVIVAPNVAPLGGACEQTAQRTDPGSGPPAFEEQR